MHRLIVGAVNSDSAKIWIRGTRKQAHAICSLSSGQDYHERHCELSSTNSFIDVIRFQDLVPDRTYDVALSFQDASGTKILEESGTFATFPDSPEMVHFLAGSCHFHGWAPFIRDDRVTIQRLKELSRETAFSLQMGDQIYTDRPLPCYTKSDFERAYEKTWGRKSMRDFLSTNAHFMIPSDHEVINDFEPDGRLSFKQRFLLLLRGQLRPNFQTLLASGRDVFREQQRFHAPQKFGSQVHYDAFSYGSFQFFLTDQRFERSTKRGEMISAKQLETLLQWLEAHCQEVCFVVGESPFLFPRASNGSWNDKNFSAQRKKILRALYSNQNHRVVFLSGDVHASFHASAFLESDSSSPLTLNELVLSPINATLMKSRSKFPDIQRVELEEATCHFEMTEKSFIGPKHAYDTMNSSVGLIQASQDEVKWQVWRTRRREESPILDGQFKF